MICLLLFALCASAHIFIFLSWYSMWSVWAPGMERPVRAFLSMTLVWSQIIAVVLILGLFGCLTRFTVVFANLAIASGVTVIAFLNRSAALQFRGLVASLKRRLAPIRGQRLVALTLLAPTLGFSWYVMLEVFFPPVGYDDFAYHLPGAALALQNRSFVPIPVPLRLQAINCFPQISEFLSIWCFSLLGRDSMIVAWQSGMYLYFAAACWVLCRACGCSRTGSLYGLSLAAVTPTLLAQILSSYNDVCVAAFFSAALAFAVIAGRDPRLAYLIGLGLSCGGLLATKLSAPLLVGVALVVFVVQSIVQNVSIVRLVRSIGIIVFAATALGGYWYIRNYLTYGNPLYPFVVHFAGIVLPGTASPLTPAFLNPELGRLPLFERLWGLWLEQKSHHGYWFYNYGSDYTGFGPVWLIIGVPSIVGAMLISLGRRHWTTLLVLSAAVAAYLGFQGNMSVRYTLFVLPVMALGIATMIDRMHRNQNAAGTGLQAGVARGSLLFVKSMGAMLAFLTVGLMLFAVKDPPLILDQIRNSTASKVEPGSPVLGGFISARERMTKGSLVVFDESVDFIYPLWRPDLANRVRFISSAQPLERWASAASSLGARYVFAKTGPTIPADVRSPLAGWIALHPSSFRLVASVPNYGELYERL